MLMNIIGNFGNISLRKVRKGIQYTKTSLVLSGSSMIMFPFVIAISEQDMPGIEPGPLGWHIDQAIFAGDWAELGNIL